MLELWMLWSRSLTNLLFFSFSFLSLRAVWECMAGERLPALEGRPRCLGLTGEGVERSGGTAGGGTTSTTWTGREEGRGMFLGLTGITVTRRSKAYLLHIHCRQILLLKSDISTSKYFQILDLILNQN